MAQLSDDCFAFGGPLMSVEEAAWAARGAPKARDTSQQRINLDMCLLVRGMGAIR